MTSQRGGLTALVQNVGYSGRGRKSATRRGGCFVKTRSLRTRALARIEPLERRVLFAAGDLDPTFGGGDGVADTDLAGGAEAIAVQADGSVVAAGATLTEPGDSSNWRLSATAPTAPSTRRSPPRGRRRRRAYHRPGLGHALARGGRRRRENRRGLRDPAPPRGHPDRRAVQHRRLPDTDFGEGGRTSELIGHGFDVTSLAFSTTGRSSWAYACSAPAEPMTEASGSTPVARRPFQPRGGCRAGRLGPHCPVRRPRPRPVRAGGVQGRGGTLARAPPRLRRTGRSWARPRPPSTPCSICTWPSCGSTPTGRRTPRSPTRFTSPATPTLTRSRSSRAPAASFTPRGTISRWSAWRPDRRSTRRVRFPPPTLRPRRQWSSTPRVTNATTPAVTFTVRYEDDAAPRGDTFDGTDVRVTAPDGTSTLARLEVAALGVGTPADGPRRDITYSYAPPAVPSGSR